MISREEAIEILQYASTFYSEHSPLVKALDMAIEDMQKLTPQKVIRHDGNYSCPACSKPAMAVSARKKKYCDFCGQAIDWSDIE